MFENLVSHEKEVSNLINLKEKKKKIDDIIRRLEEKMQERYQIAF